MDTGIRGKSTAWGKVLRYWFYPLYVLGMVLLVMVLDAAIGQIYVRYMVIFTGTTFMLGMLVGEGKEQRLEKRQEAADFETMTPGEEIAGRRREPLPPAQNLGLARWSTSESDPSSGFETVTQEK